jgi:hypothetical protein
MRTGLIVFGVIFLVLGGFLFFRPSQTAQATTTTVGEATADTRTSYATVTAPPSLTYASLLIGLVLLVLGFALPGPRAPVVHDAGTDSEVSTTEVDEERELDDGVTRKVTHHKHVTHKSTK